jgi:hypothetical protein
MKKKVITLAALLLASCMLITACSSKGPVSGTASGPAGTTRADNTVPAETSRADILAKQTKNLSPKIVGYGLNAFEYAKKRGETKKNILTIVDFTQPSTNKRLYVFDLNNNKLLLSAHVAQGKFSGLYYATHFSNKAGSRESSLGVFTTGDIYNGEHGRSMRIIGLEKGINDKAYQRSVVVHQAAYMTDRFIKEHHHAGRSFGCFAVAPDVITPLIDATYNGSVIFAYAAKEQFDPNINTSVD